jgi:hypothetical protein
MKIYYFNTEIEYCDDCYGSGRGHYFRSKEALIEDALDWAYQVLDEDEYENFENSLDERIVTEELSCDYYAIQGWCDGFGNDTYTYACYPTYEQAVKHCEEGQTIVPQYWGAYDNNFN